MNLDIHRDKPCNKWKLTKPELVLNPNLCLALTPYSARELIFSGVIVGVYRPALLILTLFQKNIYKVNVREYPWGFMSRKWTLSIINLNKTSMLNEGNHWMKMCLKLAYSAFSSSPSKDPTISTFFFFFFTFCWSFNLLMSLSLPKRDCNATISLSVAMWGLYPLYRRCLPMSICWFTTTSDR